MGNSAKYAKERVKDDLCEHEYVLEIPFFDDCDDDMYGGLNIYVCRLCGSSTKPLEDGEDGD